MTPAHYEIGDRIGVEVYGLKGWTTTEATLKSITTDGRLGVQVDSHGPYLAPSDHVRDVFPLFRTPCAVPICPDPARALVPIWYTRPRWDGPVWKLDAPRWRAYCPAHEKLARCEQEARAKEDTRTAVYAEA